MATTNRQDTLQRTPQHTQQRTPQHTRCNLRFNTHRNVDEGMYWQPRIVNTPATHTATHTLQNTFCNAHTATHTLQHTHCNTHTATRIQAKQPRQRHLQRKQRYVVATTNRLHTLQHSLQHTHCNTHSGDTALAASPATEAGINVSYHTHSYVWTHS